MYIATTIGLLFLSLTTPPAYVDADRQAIEHALNAFARGASDRDEAALRRALHAQSRQFVPSEKGVMELDLATYIELISSGKIGGEPLTVRVHYLRVDGVVASAEATFEGPTMKLKHNISFVQGSEGWQIIATVVRMIPKSAESR